jgi:hypothetical protein
MTDMWQIWGWVAWAVSIALFGVMTLDFFRVNRSTDEDVLLSSRENYDELLVPETGVGGQ